MTRQGIGRVAGTISSGERKTKDTDGVGTRIDRGQGNPYLSRPGLFSMNQQVASRPLQQVASPTNGEAKMGTCPYSCDTSQSDFISFLPASRPPICSHPPSPARTNTAPHAHYHDNTTSWRWALRGRLAQAAVAGKSPMRCASFLLSRMSWLVSREASPGNPRASEYSPSQVSSSIVPHTTPNTGENGRATRPPLPFPHSDRPIRVDNVLHRQRKDSVRPGRVPRLQGMLRRGLDLPRQSALPQPRRRPEPLCAGPVCRGSVRRGEVRAGMRVR